MQRFELLGSPMDSASMEETVETIRSGIENHRFIQHVVVNAAKLVQMRIDPLLRASVHACDLINIDGMGVVFAARWLGHPVAHRIAGIDLFHALVQMSAQQGFPIFLLGAEPAIVATVANRLQAQHPGLRIAGYHHGYFWSDEKAMVNSIRASGAKLLFVAITSPKKENFINRWREQLGVQFVMGVGGTFDVVAGKVARAPRWMQTAGLEWLFRALQEPGRLGRRYLLTNWQFAGLVLRAKWAQRRADTGQ